MRDKLKAIAVIVVCGAAVASPLFDMIERHASNLHLLISGYVLVLSYGTVLL